MSDRSTDLRQIFIIFSKKNHTKTHFQFVKTVGGNAADTFSDGNTCLDRAFPFSKLIREFSTPSVAVNGLLRQVSKFFSMFMSNPMLRYDTIGRIELIPSIVLSSNNTNCKNDIQLFLQLFDELSVYRDYH